MVRRTEASIVDRTAEWSGVRSLPHGKQLAAAGRGKTIDLSRKSDSTSGSTSHYLAEPTATSAPIETPANRNCLALYAPNRRSSQTVSHRLLNRERAHVPGETGAISDIGKLEIAKRR